MATRYAEKTTVSTEKSRLEIERTLKRYGAISFAYGSDATRATIGFTIENRMVRFTLPLPDKNAREFTHHSRGLRTRSAREAAYEQSCRQCWRALNLVIKAKLEAVAAGITTVEDEFLAHTVLPDGSTFGEWAKPQVDKAYEIGEMPSSLMIGYTKEEE